METQNVDPSIGKRAAQVVNEMTQGRSLRNTVEMLGVTRQAWYKWKNGQGVTGEVLARMAEQGYDVMYILTGERTRKGQQIGGTNG